MTRCIHQLAKGNRTHALSLTISSLMCNMYVDDLLKSLDTIKDVRTLYRKIIQLFADSGFQLMKWATNAVEVYADIPENQRAPTNTLLQDHNSPTTQGQWGFGGTHQRTF